MFLTESAVDPHRRHADAQPVSVRAAGSRHRRALPASRPASKRRCATCQDLQDVTSDLQIKNPQVSVDLDREQIAALGLTVDQVESALQSAYGSRQVSQIFAPEDRVPGHHAGRAGVTSAIRRRCRCSTCRRRAGKLVPLSTVVDQRQTRRAAVGQPHRPAAVGDAVVQPRAWRRARRRGRARAAAGAQTLPATIAGSFQGTAQAFQDSMRGLGWVLVARHLRHLRGAGHPLRELHPSAHDSLGPAVGRIRRAADAADLQPGPEHLRVRRRHHAGRPREEERHHDGRLRHRGAARAEAQRGRKRSTRPAWSASGRS